MGLYSTHKGRSSDFMHFTMAYLLNTILFLYNALCHFNSHLSYAEENLIMYLKKEDGTVLLSLFRFYK